MKYDSLIAVLKAFPDEESCIKHLEELRWPMGIVCPCCGSTRKIYHIARKHIYKCADCNNQFSVRKNTIFEESRLPLQKWFLAAWLITANRKGIASTQLSREIGVSQKTAWFMLGRLREVAGAMAGMGGPMSGTVEADETYMGGKEKNKHASKRTNAGRDANIDMDALLTRAVHHIPRRLMEHWLNKIHCDDCLKVMAMIPANSVDLIVTSPPYNLRNSTGGGLRNGNGGKWQNAALLNGYAESDDAMPYDEYVKWQRECLTAMMRLLPENGAIFYNHKWRVQGGLLQERSSIVQGFPVRQIIIWQREGGINFNAGYFLPTYEVIYLICKPDFKLAPKANARTDVWRIPQESNNPHPAPFPVELAQQCIESTAAQIVLDPFIGSGSTAIAAEALHRQWIGIEISKDYCKLANERIEVARKLLKHE